MEPLSKKCHVVGQEYQVERQVFSQGIPEGIIGQAHMGNVGTALTGVVKSGQYRGQKNTAPKPQRASQEFKSLMTLPSCVTN